MNYTTLIKTIWADIYAPDADIPNLIEQYFHHNYQQCINGVVLNRTQYIDHVVEQRKNLTVNTIDYKHIMEKADKLFAIYYPKGKAENNQCIEAEVIAYFHFKDQKILEIHGQVRLISGEPSDVDM